MKYYSINLKIINIIKWLFILNIFIFIFISYNYYFENSKNKITKKTFNLIKKINKYIIFCRKGILIEPIKTASENPIVTIIISLYNSAKTIKGCIRSVQNQKMSDIEIIVTEDCSTDNSLEILEKLKNKDPRIKIIKNKYNKGILYSRSIAALNAKGRYISSLDSDDLLINKDIFNICYNHSGKKIDIIEFSGFTSSTETLPKNKNPIIPYYLRFKKNNQIIIQPKLSHFIYEEQNNTIIRLIDGFIWAKFIKNNIYKNAINFLGNIIFYEKINYGEDRIINFLLFRIANSFKFIEEYGLIYYNISTSITNTINSVQKCHDELINIMSIFNITKNSSDSKIVIYELSSRWNSIILPGLNQKNKQYTKNLINKILQNKYITDTDKKKIQIFLNYL